MKMKTFVTQTSGGVAVIASKDEKSAAKALDIPAHQFMWAETTDPNLVRLAKKDEIIVIEKEQDETVKIKKETKQKEK